MLIFLLACIFQNHVLATINVLDKGVVPLEENSVGIQFFIDVENEDRTDECLVQTWTKRCCLTDSEKEDCNIMHVHNAHLNTVKPRDRETLLHVYPSLYQHDQMGFCDFVLNSKCGKSARTVREVVNIPFDTRIPYDKPIPDLLAHYIGQRKTEECSFLDEDTLNNCAPVNCDQKYSEARPFYDIHLSKCIEAALCAGTIGNDLPDIVYVPKSNICRNLDRPLTSEDILEISRGMVVTPTTLPLEEDNNITEKVEIKSNCSTVSQNLLLIRDLMLGKLCPMLNVDTSDYKTCINKALIKIASLALLAVAALTGLILLIYLIGWINRRRKDGSLQDTFNCLICKITRKRKTADGGCKYNVSRINQDVKNSLLRQVIVRDIPMELRESVVDICDRMDRDIRWKKRYREEEIGSQISLGQGETSETSSLDEVSDDEREKLLR